MAILINREEAKCIIDNWEMLKKFDFFNTRVSFDNKEAIKGFSEGKEIECLYPDGKWMISTDFTINISDYIYRVTPSKSKEEDFFEQVKGKKIRRKEWTNKTLYFTPQYCSKINMIGRYSTFEDMLNFEPILNGFENWEFYKEPEYIPFTFEDAPKLIGKVIRHKLNKTLNVVYDIKHYWDTSVYKTWFEDYELLTIVDDVITKVEPCGKIKEE